MKPANFCVWAVWQMGFIQKISVPGNVLEAQYTVQAVVRPRHSISESWPQRDTEDTTGNTIEDLVKL
jgi:hypothetical protein